LASPEARLRRLELLALGVVALGALAFQLRLPSRLPTPADERAVAEVLGREARPGDVLLLHPWWTERARLFVPAEPKLKVVGYQGSEADPLTAFPRIWVLSQPWLPRADTAGFERAFLPGRTPLGNARTFGTLKLALYQNGRHRPVRFSADEALARASVYLQGPDEVRRPCPFDGQAYRCGGTVHVAAEWHELHFQPRHCLYFAPPGGNLRLVAEFSQVPPGALLRLEGGLIWDRGAFRGAPYSLTHFGVEDAQSGKPLLRVDLPPGLEGLQRAEAPADFTAPGTLRLWSQADRAELRELCVELWVLGDEGPRP